MNDEQFVSILKDIMQVEFDISDNMKLDELDEWDSLTKMQIVTWLKKHYKYSVSYDVINSIKEVSDLTNLVLEIDKNYEDFLKTGFVMIKDYYLDKACFLNRDISVQVFNEKKSGTVKEVNDFGELVLEKDNKELVLTMGDIL